MVNYIRDKFRDFAKDRGIFYTVDGDLERYSVIIIFRNRSNKEMSLYEIRLDCDLEDIDMAIRNIKCDINNHAWVWENMARKHTVDYSEMYNIDVAALHPKTFAEAFNFKPHSIPSIKNVIFNDPATIVFWNDGTKTIVKAQDGDIFDSEKGLAMAISKKALGNKGNYCETFKKWTKNENRE